MTAQTGASPSGRLKLFVGAAVLILVVGAGGYEGYALSQPKAEMTLTNITPIDAQSSCGFFFQNPQEIGATFTIVNTGKADGFASVSISGGGSILMNNTYYVKAGQSANETMTVNVDCSQSFSVSAWISQVRSS